MTAQHLEFLVEERSMEAFLRALLPNLLPRDRTFEVHAFQGKRDLLQKLESRLRAYARWLPDESRIVVMVDRDNEDCHALKEQLEEAADRAGLRSRSRANERPWQLVNRVVIEELEAWYFGDWEAVRVVYPKIPETIPNKAAYRVPDAIVGGTWEAFERILKRHGFFTTGLRKVEAAQAIAAHIDPERNRSHSFGQFADAIAEATA